MSPLPRFQNKDATHGCRHDFGGRLPVAEAGLDVAVAAVGVRFLGLDRDDPGDLDGCFGGGGGGRTIELQKVGCCTFIAAARPANVADSAGWNN